MIRPAKFIDIPRLCEIGKASLEDSNYKDITPSREIGVSFLKAMLFSRNHLTLVYERDGVVEGLFIGTKDRMYFTTKKHAMDVLFIGTSKIGAGGAFLLKRFIDWAKADDDVVSISLRLSAQTEKQDRVGKMYEALGFEPVGIVYQLEVTQ